MAVITIDAFNGEIPRSLVRDLPNGSAQVNLNLVAGNKDFRPVNGSSVIFMPSASAPPPNTVSIYRKQRNDSGDILRDTSKGWLFSTSPISYVKGQVEDDAYERIYYSYDTGSAAPRVTNSLSEDYVLGVPPPPKPTVSILKANKVTRETAQTWRDRTFNKAVYDAVMSCLSINQVTSRYTSNASIAGITSLINTAGTYVFEYFPNSGGLSNRNVYEPWNITIDIPTSLVSNSGSDGMYNQQLNGLVRDGFIRFGVPVFPLWGVLNTVTLRTNIVALKDINGGTLFTDKQVDFLLAAFASLVSADYYVEVKLKRSELDASYLNYVKSLEKIKENGPTPTAIRDETEDALAVRVTNWKNSNASAITSVVSAWNKCADISHQIEAAYIALHDDLQNVLTTWLNNIPLERTSDNIDGLVVLDSDPVIDVRFYITTYVTNRGEESSPSEPSERLELDWNDLAVIDSPGAKTGYANITKWRLYRSNSGANSSAFQFVSEQALADKPTASVSDLTGTVGTELAGYGDKNKWRDIVATWLIHKKRGLIASTAPLSAFLDTSKLQIGDTVTQTLTVLTKTEYFATKTWNGSAWVAQSVPSVSGLTTRSCYVDGKYGSLLGETCPTTTWLPPPFRCDPTDISSTYGSNPHIRGFENMPNGVIAGFIDNFVAFCEPYVPYAWPVEYQIPLEHPIVGLCAFGQSLLVGTMANPYVISGTDSASMSARKLNVSQSCVSARSMVSAMGGVFYASPDGYCFANESGVEVVTASLFSNEDWRALVPSSIFAVVHDSVLYFWYAGNGGGCFGLDMVAKKLVRVWDDPVSGEQSFRATAAFEDVVTDAVYVTNSSQLKQLFSWSRMNGKWKSARICLSKHEPLSWLKVLSDFESGPVTVNWYGGPVLRHTVNVSSTLAVRLPSGRYFEHEFEVISKSRVSSISVTSTTEELQAS